MKELVIMIQDAGPACQLAQLALYATNPPEVIISAKAENPDTEVLPTERWFAAIKKNQPSLTRPSIIVGSSSDSTDHAIPLTVSVEAFKALVNALAESPVRKVKIYLTTEWTDFILATQFAKAPIETRNTLDSMITLQNKSAYWPLLEAMDEIITKRKAKPFDLSQVTLFYTGADNLRASHAPLVQKLLSLSQKIKEKKKAIVSLQADAEGGQDNVEKIAQLKVETLNLEEALLDERQRLVDSPWELSRLFDSKEYEKQLLETEGEADEDLMAYYAAVSKALNDLVAGFGSVRAYDNAATKIDLNPLAACVEKEAEADNEAMIEIRHGIEAARLEPQSNLAALAGFSGILTDFLYQQGALSYQHVKKVSVQWNSNLHSAEYHPDSNGNILLYQLQLPSLESNPGSFYSTLFYNDPQKQMQLTTRQLQDLSERVIGWACGSSSDLSEVTPMPMDDCTIL